jgi:hypothetical protein
MIILDRKIATNSAKLIGFMDKLGHNLRLALKPVRSPVAQAFLPVRDGTESAGHDEQCNGADKVIPVDLYIPGCPPHPLTILDGLLRFVGTI